jgi:hypothetical protein
MHTLEKWVNVYLSWGADDFIISQTFESEYEALQSIGMTDRFVETLKLEGF